MHFIWQKKEITTLKSHTVKCKILFGDKVCVLPVSYLIYVPTLSTFSKVEPISQGGRPIIYTDLHIQTTFEFRWVAGFEEAGCSDFGPGKIPYRLFPRPKSEHPTSSNPPTKIRMLFDL